jgi:hypothetical protein
VVADEIGVEMDSFTLQVVVMVAALLVFAVVGRLLLDRFSRRKREPGDPGFGGPIGGDYGEGGFGDGVAAVAVTSCYLPPARSPGRRFSTSS